MRERNRDARPREFVLLLSFRSGPEQSGHKREPDGWIRQKAGEQETGGELRMARKQQRVFIRVFILATAISLAALATGCGGGESTSEQAEPATDAAEADTETAETTAADAEQETSEAGSGQVKEGLSLAFFSVGGNNTYLKAGMQGAQDAAAEYGASIQIFNGEFDGEKQLNQVTGAIASGDFDGFVLEANNPQQLCSAADATLEADIALAVTNVPVCQDEYDAYPGTTIFVGGQSPDVYTQWFTQGFESGPGGEFAVLNGPAVHGNTTRARQVLDELKPQYPDWEEVAFDATEYQASVALTKTENILNKNPDIKVIFSSYSGHTAGIIAAVKAAGKIGEIGIYDLGGDQQMFKALENDEIASTQVFLPYEEQYRAVQSVIAKLSGLDELDGVPATGTFWDLCEDPKLNGLPCFVNKADIPKYEAIGIPEY
jgi:ribose transport system substrate-binding protein